MTLSPINRVSSSSHWLNYNLTRITDSNGNYINFNYVAGPANGNYWIPTLSSITDSAGSALLTITRTTDGWGRVTAVSDRYSRSVYYAYETSTGYHLLKQESIVVTTGTSSPTIRDAFTYHIYTGWNHNHYVLYTVASLSPTGSGTATTTINYDNSTSAVANVVDANGNKRTYTQPSGSQTKVTVADSVGTTVTSFTATFDSRLNMTAITDGTNTTTVHTYAFSDTNAPDQASTITDANSNSIVSTFDSHGNLATTTSPLGTVTTYTNDYTYFPLGRITQVQEGSKLPTSFVYNEPSGTIQSVTWPEPGGSGSYVSSSYTYDSLGNILTSTSPGNNACTSTTTTFNYTTDGTYSQSDAIAQPIKITNNLGKVVHLRYDSQARPTSVTDAVGNENDTSYNIVGQVLTTVAPATGQTGTGHSYTQNTYLWPGGPASATQLYDESGTLVRTSGCTYGLEGELLGTSGNNDTASFTYDAAYRLLTSTDGNSHSTTKTYNTAGYIATISDATSGVTHYTSYDSAGNLLSQTDPNGVVTNYVYSGPGGLLSDVQFPATTSLNESYSYDSYGRTTGVTDGTGSVSSTYDDMDHPLTTSRTYTGIAAQNFSYTYYPDGSRETLACPAGTWTYYYDGVGRYASMTSPAGTSYASYADNGWQTGRTLPNGVVTSYTLNAVGQETDCLSQTAGSTTLSHYNSFTYDANGNVTGLTASIPALTSYGGTTIWQYNSKDQLTQEQTTRFGGYTDNFAYDSASNPTTFRGTTLTFNNSNELTVAGFSYDSNGNPTTYGGTTFTYDPKDHLTAVGSVMSSGYRSDGLRAWTTEGGSTTYYLYDGGAPIYEMDGTGTITATDVFAPDGLVARKQGGSWIEYTFDNSGSVAQRLDTSASILTTSGYNDYGQETSSGSHSDPFGYEARYGYQTDQVTGLILCRARYYDPAYGRFVNRDPIGIAGGMNLYGYASGNPISSCDPSGLSPTGASGENEPWYDVDNDYYTGLYGRFKNSTFGQLYSRVTSVTGCDPVGQVYHLVTLPHRIGHIGEAAATKGWRGWLEDGSTALETVTLAVGGMEVGSALSEVGQAGDHIVLGLKGGLEELAEQIGGRHLMENPEGWEQEVLNGIADPKTKFSLKLDGLDGEGAAGKLLNCLAREEGATAWEVKQLFNSGRMGSVELFENGVRVANPFSW